MSECLLALRVLDVEDECRFHVGIFGKHEDETAQPAGGCRLELEFRVGDLGAIADWRPVSKTDETNVDVVLAHSIDAYDSWVPVRRGEIAHVRGDAPGGIDRVHRSIDE
jgi:hypothetical protein